MDVARANSARAPLVPEPGRSLGRQTPLIARRQSAMIEREPKPRQGLVDLSDPGRKVRVIRNSQIRLQERI